MHMYSLRPIAALFSAVMTCTACTNDDVYFVQESHELPVTEVAVFHLDEGSGSNVSETISSITYNVSGRGLNWMSGVANKALFFDGLSNEISGSISTALLPSQQFAASLWVSPQSYPVGIASVLSMTQENSSTGINIGLNNLGQIVVTYFIEGTVFQKVANQTLPQNTWSYLTAAVNTQEGKLSVFLNTEEVVSENLPTGQISWEATSTPIHIGKSGIPQFNGIYDVSYFSGAIDEVKIYSGLMEQETVAYLYNEYTKPSTVAYEVHIDYTNDTNRPTYHAIPSYGWANESYGLLALDGQYHMFYQKNAVYLGIANQNWGHFTSSDLVHWTDENAVLTPSVSWDSYGIWSGDAIILEDGTPAVVYTGVNGVKAGIGTATSTDNYATLQKNINNPVIAGAPSDVDSDFRDPYVWHEDGKYHMIVGSGVSSTGGNIVYYSSIDFENWTYGGIAFQGDKNRGEGGFWEMPVIYSFPNGKEVLIVQKTPDSTPARTFYWVGQFENGVFTPEDRDMKYLEVVNRFLSPTVTTDLSGDITAIGIIPDEVTAEFQQAQGWANLFSVPQKWTLDENNNLLISAHPSLQDARGSQTSIGEIQLNSTLNLLNDYQGRHFEIEATIDLGDATTIGFVVGRSSNGQEVTKCYYNVQTQEWTVDTTTSSESILVTKDVRTGSYSHESSGTMNLNIFVDGSVLEVFIDGKAHFTSRFYPTQADAQGVGFYTEGGTASADVTIYDMQ